MEKKNYELVISINVFQKPLFLLKQLENIKTFVEAEYCVILNCNDLMFHELQKMEFPSNIFINPIIINKKRFHGSLTLGIISNMSFALENMIFKYFIVISGRTMFYKKMSLENLDVLQKKWSNLDEYFFQQKSSFNNNDLLILDCLGVLNEHNLNILENNKLNNENNLLDGWWPDGWCWPWFKNTKLAQHYFNLGFRLECSYHEGLVFSYQVSSNIIYFLNNNYEILNDLCNFPCSVEEFSLQTISCNEVNNNNLEYGFSFIGQGNVDPNKYDFSKENCFVLKVNPDDFD
jgi:hypothetical protein